ncbi:MAG: DUF4136 domain-containing protein [Verrucomicrobiota bacterium]
MKFSALASIFVMVFLSGCISPTKVDFDRAALEEMATYQSFAIDSRETRKDYQDVVLSPIVERRIERAIVEELVAKGFQQKKSDTDFRITFNTVTKTRTEINDFGPPPFRRYPYYGFGGRFLDIDQYEEGTFIIDVIDSESSELVWRGAYVKRLGWSAPDEAEVQQIVSEILQSFPPDSVLITN